MPKTTTPHRTPTRRTAARVLGLPGLATAALALSGCGSQVPPLEEVWPEVSASIQNATSVAIDGDVTQGGEDMAVNIAGQIDDSSYSGSVSMGEADVQVVGNAESTYMKPNAAFYETMGGAQIQDLVGDKWLEVPADQGGFTMSTFWSSFSDDIPDAEEFNQTDYTSEIVEHNGEEVYRYSGTSAENGEPVTLYISQDKKLVRVEVEQAESSGESTDGASASASPSDSASGSAGADAGADTGSGTVDFADWDAVEPVEMPAEAEVFTVPGM